MVTLPDTNDVPIGIPLKSWPLLPLRSLIVTFCTFLQVSDHPGGFIIATGGYSRLVSQSFEDSSRPLYSVRSSV